MFRKKNMSTPQFRMTERHFKKIGPPSRFRYAERRTLVRDLILAPFWQTVL
jgi:hypothetical protein